MYRYKYIEENNLRINGVVHVGGHRAEELSEHTALGAEKIIWIEANPDVYKEMLIALQHSKIDNYPFCFACSDVDDQHIEFNIIYGPDAEFMKGNKGVSSLLEPDGRFNSWLKEKITCRTITLDTLIKRNNFNFNDFQLLEMDVQGGELMVLKGATELLKHVDYVSSEVTLYNPDYKDAPLFSDINSYLVEHGFSHVETVFYPGVSNWGDALFVKDNHA